MISAEWEYKYETSAEWEWDSNSDNQYTEIFILFFLFCFFQFYIVSNSPSIFTFPQNKPTTDITYWRQGKKEISMQAYNSYNPCYKSALGLYAMRHTQMCSKGGSVWMARQ